MGPATLLLPTALVVGHPGHELRLFRWLECAHPLVYVLTDGSGSGRSRISSTRDLLAATGCAAGSVLGAFTDVEIYEAMMTGDVTRLAAVTELIAQSLAASAVRSVVADAFEFYNPTHDLCSIVATLAAKRAEVLSGVAVQRYNYAVTRAASGDGVIVNLEPADVERKIAAAYRFENLSNDVTELLAAVGHDDVAREILRPLTTSIDLPSPEEKPFYEVRGEERVASGVYRDVLRYDRHFVPFVRALAGALGATLTEAAPQTVPA